jgi:hypothetical protein
MGSQGNACPDMMQELVTLRCWASNRRVCVYGVHDDVRLDDEAVGCEHAWALWSDAWEKENIKTKNVFSQKCEPY